MSSTEKTPKIPEQYTTPEQQSAYIDGLKRGRKEGMLMYQRRILKQLESDNMKLNQQLQA